MTETKEKYKYKELAKEEIYKLAEDIFNNKVFTSEFHCRNKDEVDKAFPILRLMSNISTNLLENNIMFVYEYFDKAGPRMCNGLPIFLSCKFLNKKDFKYVLDLLKKMRNNQKQLEKEFLKQ